MVASQPILIHTIHFRKRSHFSRTCFMSVTWLLSAIHTTILVMNIYQILYLCYEVKNYQFTVKGEI